MTSLIFLSSCFLSPTLALSPWAVLCPAYGPAVAGWALATPACLFFSVSQVLHIKYPIGNIFILFYFFFKNVLVFFWGGIFLNGNNENYVEILIYIIQIKIYYLYFLTHKYLELFWLSEWSVTLLDQWMNSIHFEVSLFLLYVNRFLSQHTWSEFILKFVNEYQSVHTGKQSGH